ncbi:MAG: D-tyrosyl-tRNA(Tyr) deacylase [Clostridiaceae bacterium]|nr:D-tyrosyl-tRNA(Tyr) deacylase [Clostridiaceae bacterium]
MRVLIQRVSRASVTIDEQCKASINRGFLVFLGVAREDTREDAIWLARKISSLRVFSDSAGKMNLNLLQAEGSLLLISQFTLYADTRRGNRPGFSEVAEPGLGERLYEELKSLLVNLGLEVKTGVFGADMQVELINDGPVTILIDSAERKMSRRGELNAHC